MFFGHENMGITFGIFSISALPPEILRNLGFRCRPSWFYEIPCPKNGGLATNRTFLSIIVLELGRFICSEWRPFWNARWRPPGGVSELGPDLKIILVWYPTHMPSFIISSKSEIFWWYFCLCRLTMSKLRAWASCDLVDGHKLSAVCNIHCMFKCFQ